MAAALEDGAIAVIVIALLAVMLILHLARTLGPGING